MSKFEVRACLAIPDENGFNERDWFCADIDKCITETQRAPKRAGLVKDIEDGPVV